MNQLTEDQIEGLNNRLESFENEIKESEDGIKFEENSISTSKENHKKYEGDLKKVRNNRALSFSSTDISTFFAILVIVYRVNIFLG